MFFRKYEKPPEGAKSLFRSLIAIGALLSVMAGMSSPVNAALYRVAFTQDGLGDSAPDWFGSFTGPDSGVVPITDLSATVNSISYSSRTTRFGPINFFNDSSFWPVMSLVGFAFDQDLVSAPDSQSVLQLYSFASNNVVSNLWTISPCNDLVCGGGQALGTYEITRAATPVPLPGSLSLIAIGLVGLGAISRRRA